MLFTNQTIDKTELTEIANFFEQFDNQTVELVQEESCVSKYITSLVCGQYQKSVEDIENTTVGNKMKRKRSLQQVMQESFFYGANRFGNNFIA